MALQRERLFMTNFYAVDIETNRIVDPEPVQIAVVRFENGIEVAKWTKYFHAWHRSTKDALRTHGLSRRKLKEKKANPFCKLQAKAMIEFLDIKNEWPITSFNVEFDRDKVLKPAFKLVGLEDELAADDRWRCAQELCKRTENWKLWSLDDALEHFGFDRRKDDEFHDALHDARLAAQVYMKAIKLKPLKDSGLGFYKPTKE